MVGQLPVLRLVARALIFLAPGDPPATKAVERRGGRLSQPRWAWDTTFLGSLTATLRKEVVGVRPTAFASTGTSRREASSGRVSTRSSFPGRRTRCAFVGMEPRSSACRRASRHGGRPRLWFVRGHLRSRPDGFTRAVRDEYAHLPPVVVTPIYATADARLQWLNRAQCIGVGRVDMTALGSVRCLCRALRGPSRQASLYARLGGPDVIARVRDEFVEGSRRPAARPVLSRRSLRAEAESHRSSLRDNRRTLRLQRTRHEGGS